MRKNTLLKYADLLAGTGINVQEGQDVFIIASVEQPEFATMCAEACYRRGARKVIVEWTYQPLDKVNIEGRTLKTLSSLDSYEMEKMRYKAKNLPCLLYLDSDDPDGLKGVDMEKMTKGMQARQKKVKKYRDQMDCRYQWCIAGVPGEKWAMKVFPGVPKAKAMEMLWEKILLTARVDKDPVAAWKRHNATIKEKCTYLNSLGIDTLHYTASNGTDFTVGLMEESIFAGGAEKCLENKVLFNPNIPSEECFTSPKKGRAEGIVHASMPLSYQGLLIEDFWIRFKDGKAVEWGAAKNQDLLEKIITMDENSGYLGECALVPYSSPIRQSETLFYNTLFDENAVCHLALGRGFMDCVRDYDQRTKEECDALGVNDSIVHVDFMIGTQDLSIDAITRDGRTIPVFREGEWAF